MRELWTRTIRKTGTTYTLSLDEDAHLYWVVCEHGSRMSARTRGRAMDYAKTCDTWCDGCADGEPDVRPQRPARIVPNGAGKLVTVVDAKTGAPIAEHIEPTRQLHDVVLAEWLCFEIEEPTLPDGGADPRWFDRARCQGLPGRVFFEGAWNATADNNRGRRSKGFHAARAICLTCPVRWECREDGRSLPLALRQGVRAGYDPRELGGS